MASAFVGRTREISRLEELGAGRFVTLWGPGGVGKTRLAKEYAEGERRRGRTVVWADLAAARSRPEVLTTIAAALGVALASSEEDVEALGRAARAQRALLVADNVEQLDGGARDALARMASVIVADGGASILVTSRELIGATDEVGHVVAPLAEEDALALFAMLAGDAATDATGAAASTTARAIVKRLDALPLAIELAAARVPLLGVAELLARLDRKLDVLGTSKNDRPARHATLRAAIAWSWDLLDDAEREALMACATFEAPFDASLAERVIGGPEAEALDRLERLRRRALVHASSDSGGRTTLQLLESVRDFAREASAASGDAEARRHRHAEAVVSRSEPLAEAASCGRDVRAALDALRADLVAASRSGGGWATMARATLSLAALYAISGPASAAVESVDAALSASAAAAAGSADASASALLVAKLLVARGDALRALGKHVDARVALERASVVAADLGEAPEVHLVGAEAARVLGSVLRALGFVEQALERKHVALAAYRAIGDRAREGICLGEIGAVHQSEGRLARAKVCHAEAIAIHVATGSRRAEGVERSYLAVATHRGGDPASSIALHNRAMAIHREVGHRRLEGAERLHLGFVHHELGALGLARDAFEGARGMLAAAGARGLEAIALVFAARLEVDAGDPTAALLKLAEASQVVPASWPRVAATRHLVEGHLALATGALARAQSSYEASLATSRDLEVGFEALTPAYLAVAIARASAAGMSAAALASVRAHLEDARERLTTTENPHLRVALDVLAACAEGRVSAEVPSASSASSSEVRRALALSGTARALVIEAAGKRVVLPDGRVVDLSRRKNVRLVLLALAQARCTDPGVAVLPDALLEAGWAGERMRSDAATKRLHTAIWTLRSLGFEALLLREGDGYLLDPRINLVLADA